MTPVGLQMVNTPDGPAVSGWPNRIDAGAADAPHTLLLLADPFTFPVEAFLARLGEDRPGLQVIGGMASAAHGPGGNRLVLDDELHLEGAVGVLLSGPPNVRAVVSQGCRPIGSRSSSPMPRTTSCASSGASRRSSGSPKWPTR